MKELPTRRSHTTSRGISRHNSACSPGHELSDRLWKLFQNPVRGPMIVLKSSSKCSQTSRICPAFSPARALLSTLIKTRFEVPAVGRVLNPIQGFVTASMEFRTRLGWVLVELREVDYRGRLWVIGLLRDLLVDLQTIFAYKIGVECRKQHFTFYLLNIPFSAHFSRGVGAKISPFLDSL